MPVTIYDIDFDVVSVELMPPDKRVQPNLAMWQGWFKGLQWIRDLFFNSYKVNSTAPVWSPGAYNKYDQVIYGKKVYSSRIDANNDTPPSDNWLLVQDNFVGTDERVLYNGEKLIFEWALNKWFSTTFRNPPSTSDIYISNNAKPIAVFRSGTVESISSTSFRKSSSEWVVNAYNFGQYNNFTINIPLAVYNALSTSADERERIVRSFADKYVTFGLFYNIVTY